MSPAVTVRGSRWELLSLGELFSLALAGDERGGVEVTPGRVGCEAF
jgi:hypothetical protein